MLVNSDFAQKTLRMLHFMKKCIKYYFVVFFFKIEHDSTVMNEHCKCETDVDWKECFLSTSGHILSKKVGLPLSLRQNCPVEHDGIQEVTGSFE